MNWSPREIRAITVLGFVAGTFLWPPGAVYWMAVATVIGATATMSVVLALAGLVGAGVIGGLGYSLASFALGGGPGRA